MSKLPWYKKKELPGEDLYIVNLHGEGRYIYEF